jgi:NAD(P)H-dependent FMN reductase
MSRRILVFYGSYRSDRLGIRLADYVVTGLAARGENVELIDAKAVGLPILDRMYKEYDAGKAPPAMTELAAKIRAADAFVFVVGEYNSGVQPGLKNLTDHFLEEWFWRPAAIASYSKRRQAGEASSFAWRNTLSELGLVVVSSKLSVGPIDQTLDDAAQPIGAGGDHLAKTFSSFAEDLAWWADAAKSQRARKAPPY